MSSKRYHEVDPKRQFDIFRPQAPIPVADLQVTAREIATNVEWGIGSGDIHEQRSCITGTAGPECINQSPMMVCSQAVLVCLDKATKGRISRLKQGEVGLWQALVEATPNAFSDSAALGPFFRKANTDSLRIPPSAVLERAREWYRREIGKAEQPCQTARTELEKSQRTLERAEALVRKASPDDTAGRNVAQQAAAAAQSAIDKNTIRRDRMCDRLEQLRTNLGQAEQLAGAVAMPVVTRGTVSVVTDKGAIPWDGRTPLQPGQTIRTGADGYAEVFIRDLMGKFALEANTTFTLSAEGPQLARGQFYYLKEELRTCSRRKPITSRWGA